MTNALIALRQGLIHVASIWMVLGGLVVLALYYARRCYRHARRLDAMLLRKQWAAWETRRAESKRLGKAKWSATKAERKPERKRDTDQTS